MIRAFVALDLNDEVQRFLRDLISDLKRLNLDARRSRPENIHLTLKFLGDVSEKQLDPLSEALGKAADSTPCFSLTVEGVGIFPNLRRPRIIWAGLKREPHLIHLQRQVEEQMNQQGFKAEQRAFTPHLTLARLRRPGKSRKIKTWLRDHSQLHGPSWFVSEVILFRSDLTPEGPRYTPLARHRLADSSQLLDQADEESVPIADDKSGGSLDR